MKKLRHIWQVWLTHFRLGGEEEFREYVAELSSTVALDCESLVDRVVREGSEVHRETLRATVLRVLEVAEESLLSGHRVDMGSYILIPRVLGKWRGGEPSGVKLTLEIRLKKSFRARLGEVKLSILGYRGLSNQILRVTDRASGLRDGTITLGDDILIEGERIKVEGYGQSDGSLESGIGVYFVDKSGHETCADRIDENTMSRVLVRVPGDLHVGEPYTLEIRTRYTRGTLSTSIRSVLYASPLRPCLAA
jgi:hypothetical protein